MNFRAFRGDLRPFPPGSLSAVTVGGRSRSWCPCWRTVSRPQGCEMVMVSKWWLWFVSYVWFIYIYMDINIVWWYNCIAYIYMWHQLIRMNIICSTKSYLNSIMMSISSCVNGDIPLLLLVILSTFHVCQLVPMECFGHCFWRQVPGRGWEVAMGCPDVVATRLYLTNTEHLYIYVSMINIVFRTCTIMYLYHMNAHVCMWMIVNVDTYSGNKNMLLL